MYNFTWKHLSFFLSFMWTKKLTMHHSPRPSLPPSLLPFLNDVTKKKATETSQKSFLKENKHMQGRKPTKPTKLDGNQ